MRVIYLGHLHGFWGQKAWFTGTEGMVRRDKKHGLLGQRAWFIGTKGMVYQDRKHGSLGQKTAADVDSMRQCAPYEIY